MSIRLINAWNRLRSGLWFVPMTMTAAASVAVLMVFEGAEAADLQELDREGLEKRYHALAESASGGGSERSWDSR